MKLILCDKNQALVGEWKKEFVGVPKVEIYCDDIFAHPADAIVSPANFFGVMSGGIDFYYLKRFGEGLEGQLQKKIEKDFYGELPIGQGLVLPTGDKTFPFMISAPTMRTPESVEHTLNAYYAFRAALIAALGNKKIKSLVCPGLGTLTGRIAERQAARQMRVAYSKIVERNFEINPDWIRIRNEFSFDQARSAPPYVKSNHH